MSRDSRDAEADPATTAALDALYRRSHDWLRRRVLLRTGCHPGEAEDALSAAYVNVMRYAATESITPPYVLAVALHAAWEIRRSNMRQPIVSLDEELLVSDGEGWVRSTRGELDERVSTGDAEAHMEARDRLRVLGQLHPMQQQALIDEMQGFSMRESAARRGRTYSWVDRHRKEGRAAFREAIAA